MTEAIEVFAAVNLLVIGLSHIVQHRAWAELFSLLRQQGRPGAFANGFLSLVMGSLIVSFHNVWAGPALVLTVLGWAMAIKAGAAFVFPDWGVRSLGRVREENSKVLAVPGVLFVIVAVGLGWSIAFG